MIKSKLYMDSTCFIDMAKNAVGTLPDGLNNDVWFCKKLLEAHRDGKIEVFTAVLTIAECQHADGICDEKVQRLFKSLLTSGQFVFLVQDTPIIADRARNLRWTYKLAFKGADSLHIASALEMGCSEFVTSDEDILSHANEALKLGIRIIHPHETSILPDEYRQGIVPGLLPKS